MMCLLVAGQKISVWGGTCEYCNLIYKLLTAFAEFVGISQKILDEVCESFWFYVVDHER